MGSIDVVLGAAWGEFAVLRYFFLITRTPDGCPSPGRGAISGDPGRQEEGSHQDGRFRVDIEANLFLCFLEP